MKKLTCAILIAFGTASVVSSAQDRPLRPEAPARADGRGADEGRQNWGFTTGDLWTRVRVDAHGRIDLTDDEQDVKSVAPDGSFEISSKGWLSMFGQRYVVRGNADGTITRRFSVGGVDRPLDAGARAWIADTIQRAVRRGFNAEARVSRILTTKGPAGVLDEISRLSSDFSKARYFTLLFNQERLDEASAGRALTLSRQIGSDFELARVLVAFAETVPLDETLSAAFIEATRSIGSDFEHARVLTSLMSRDPVTATVVSIVLASSPSIGSDFEKGRVLRELARKPGLSADAVRGIAGVAGSIGSDFEKARVLQVVIVSQSLEGTNRQALLDTARGIGSDYERGRVLSAMLQAGSLR